MTLVSYGSSLCLVPEVGARDAVVEERSQPCGRTTKGIWADALLVQEYLLSVIGQSRQRSWPSFCIETF